MLDRSESRTMFAGNLLDRVDLYWGWDCEKVGVNDSAELGRYGEEVRSACGQVRCGDVGGH